MLLAVLYLSYFVGTHFFYHQHVLRQGVVTHSHPFGNKQHSHSAVQLCLLDQLANITSTVPDLPSLVPPCPEAPFVWVMTEAPQLAAQHSRCASLRGPPAA